MGEENRLLVDHPLRCKERGASSVVPSPDGASPPSLIEQWIRTLHDDRLVTVGFLASQCNHEARNKLEVIRAALELLAAGQEHKLTAADRAFLLREAEDYINELELHLDMARTGSGPVERLSIHALVAETLRALKPVAARSHVEVAVRLAVDGTVHGSRRLLRQVLLNVIRNAFESIYGVTHPQVLVRAASSGTWAVVNIEDNGPGVDLLRQAQCFEDFATTKPRGTGLGLAICRKIVTDVGGRIVFVAPEFLSGANVQIELPLA